MSFHVLIPARYAATRLPGKPLCDIAGKPLIRHVHERAMASGAASVVIATDDERIREAAEGFGATVCMTAADHPSGSDRIAEAVTRLGLPDDAIVVNLQGDEPLIPPAVLKQVADDLAAHPAAGTATLCERITAPDALFDPHVVKVVMDRDGYALYFTRAAVPWDRDAFAAVAPDHGSFAATLRDRDTSTTATPWDRDALAATSTALGSDAGHYRHIGIYAYRAGFLKTFVRWAACDLERTEALEQLRILWYGGKIHVAEAAAPCPPGVDRESDVERVAAAIRTRF